MAFTGFDVSLFKFLDALSRNNKREWFQKNKSRYESELLEPCLEFVRAFEPKLKKVSRYFVADDRRVGGSLMRIYRDTRFSKNKQPYKTNVGIHFRHEMGKDVHCAGFYVHFAPDECFLGAGIWHPDGPTLGKIRAAIDEDGAKWKRARDNKKFRSHFNLAGDSLKSAPRGFDKEHPLIEDLKRKDFISAKELTEKDVFNRKFLDHVAEAFMASKPLMRFVCDAQRVPF